ncbi:MAG: hypothetical protein IJX24_03455 [Oscillospiraceae bacterium]|nr:hypothetical protein [Oscillospiraceae bacterium]
MKMKYPVKDPVIATNLCIMLFPLFFIGFEMVKFSSDDIDFSIKFLLVLFLSLFMLIPSLIVSIFGVDIMVIIKPLVTLFDNKYAFIIIYSLMFILGVISFILYSKNKIRAYKKLALPISAIWLSVILMYFFMFLTFVFAYIYSEIQFGFIGFLAALICFAAFLPLYIICIITVEKIFSLKTNEQPEEKENEEIS